jgi:predicted phosphoribosyltransferase
MHVIGPFADRYEAGRQLAMRLERFAGRNDVLCELVPATFGGIGAWYNDFSQVGDVTVRNLLALQTISR